MVALSFMAAGATQGWVLLENQLFLKSIFKWENQHNLSESTFQVPAFWSSPNFSGGSQWELMDKRSTEIKAAASHSPNPVMHIERRASVEQPYIFYEQNVSCDPYSLQHMAEREAITARQAEN